MVKKYVKWIVAASRAFQFFAKPGK